MTAPPEFLGRDLAVTAALTLSLFAIGYGFRGPGRVNRFEGAALVLAYAIYIVAAVSGAGR